jgi:hypothetical protein
MGKQTSGVAENAPEPARKSVREIVEEMEAANPQKKPKIVTMEDGRESAKNEPYGYTENPRLRVEKSLSCICLLMLFFSEFGNEPLDGRIAYGLAIALDRLTDVTHSLYSPEEMLERGGKDHYVHKAGQESD